MQMVAVLIETLALRAMVEETNKHTIYFNTLLLFVLTSSLFNEGVAQIAVIAKDVRTDLYRIN